MMQAPICAQLFRPSERKWPTKAHTKKAEEPITSRRGTRGCLDVSVVWRVTEYINGALI